MPSYFSRLLMALSGAMSVVVRTTGAGSARPLASAVTEGPVISVVDGLFRSLLGMNSETLPVTQTELPTVAATGGALEVKMNTPSEVAGSPSPGDGIWMK